MKKIIGITISIILLVAGISCSSMWQTWNNKDSDSTATETAGTESGASGESFSASNKIYLDISLGKVSEDGSSWSALTTTKTKLLDSTATVKLDSDDDELIIVNLEDVIENVQICVSGNKTGGGIKIKTSTSYETGLLLDSVTINSSNYPCIEFSKAGAVSVKLEGDNTFIDGRSYGTGYGAYYTTDSSLAGTAYDDEDVYIYCKSGKVVNNGSDEKGTLYSKGDMTIYGEGELTVTQAYKNCIASKGILTIQNGTITAQNYISSTSNTGKNGFWGAEGILVSGGQVSFNGYGIISTSDLRKANGFKTDDDTYIDSWVKISGGTTQVTTYNGKGIASPYVYITGGTNSFDVSGITSYAEKTSTGSWYDADGVYETGTVKYAAEGIEGDKGFTLSGGKTYVSAVDDGVNVSNTGASLTISDGFIYVKSKGDGLDSNGKIAVSGGIVVVSQTGGGNSPIDCGEGYTFSVTGSSATVFAMGSNDMFSESIPSSTSIPMIYKTSFSGSSSLGVNNIIAVSSPYTYGAALLISNKLTSGTSYSFVKGGTISGTEYYEGVYFPATISGGTSESVTATTSSSSSSFGPGRELEWFFEDF